jgi:hypothetical protein
VRKRNLIVGCAIAFSVLGLLLGLFSFIAPASSFYFRGRTFSRTAGLGIYSDSACTKILTSLDWGAIASGNSAFQTVYIRNLGSSYLVLSMSTANWSPSNADGMIGLIWDREGFLLAPYRVTPATLTLSVSPDVNGFATFSVDAVVNGETWAPQYWTR